MQKCWVRLNGINLKYLESGKGKSRHVLFIHGLGSSAERWLKIPDVLSLQFHTIVLDLPGFGESDKPSTIDYTIENFRDVIIGFMDKIGINDGKTSIVGHSLGGYIAIEVAIINKPRIQKLVLIDSSGMLKKPTPLLEQYYKVAMNPSENEVRRVLVQMVADPSRIPSKIVEGFINRINSPNAKHALKSTLDNSANTQVGFDRLKLIEGISTLILWGIKDRVIPLNHSWLFNHAIKDSQMIIINDSGHAPFAEKPALVTEILQEFLM